MSDLSSYDEILNSLEEDSYYTINSSDFSPSLQAWSNNTGTDELDLSSLNLSSNSSSWFDPLESAITATRNGSSPVLSTLAQFTALLAQTGIHGPRILKAFNLSTRGTKIGAGNQFTVFTDPIYEGQVIKRVNVPLSSKAEQRFAASTDYRLQLRTLGLEVLSLCNPVLRAHPNITSLLAWGFDFPFADMAVPVLFMEAAMMPLSNFLGAEKRTVEVRYQLSLDVANGLEALHNLRIVHGDVKPDNVLVFAGPSERVPFRAKLSDFGVCVDLEAPDAKFMLSDYRGTQAWLAPEVEDGDLTRFRGFSSELMFRFDAYSFGLVLLSIFTGNGEAPVLDEDPENVPGQVFELLYSQEDIPTNIRGELRKAISNLLSEDPRKRPLPGPSLIRTDSSTYAAWLSSIQLTPTSKHVGIIDPIYNKGPLFWYRLDETVRKELEEQYALMKEGNAPPFPGDVLFGMAQTVTGAKPSYLDRLLRYLTEAARAGYSPARAVYAQIMAAHGRKLEFADDVLEEWMLQAISEGYFFASPSYSEKVEEARKRFRANGGFCSDPFLGKKDVVEAARDRHRALKRERKNGSIVDRKGNTILHAAAALGAINAVQSLLDDGQVSVNVENEKGETPLYKAFQAGHAQIIELLLDKGANASTVTRQEKVSPMHWLFMIPDSSIAGIARRMIETGANINATIEPLVKENSGGFPEKIQILHYPFELPHGTPLHWACFFGNMTAVEALLSLDANVNASYHASDTSTTPLFLTAYFGEPSLAKYLISQGADASLVDSMGRNTLHGITKYFPERHGYLPHHWHYWIRHGDWEQHVASMTELVRILVDAGADINAKDKAYPPLTPVAAAADLGVWDGGVICALLEAGADLSQSVLSAGDTVLHSWASIVGPRLAYPYSYLSTMKKIVNAMPDIDIPNMFEKDTPLHSLATIYHPEEEFEAACEIFLAHSPPADINAKTRRGATPLTIALETDLDPAQRGLFLLSKGADTLVLNDRGRDVFFSIVNNTALTDQASHDLIRTYLHHLNPDIQQAYTKHYLPNANSYHTLFAAAERGKPLALTLLLSLGLATRINELDPSKLPPWTVLDQALHWAEISRRAHMRRLADHKSGASRNQALEQNLVYDEAQGPPARAAEAYRSFPAVIRILRDARAKRACELDGNSTATGEYIEQPWEWDFTEIYNYGFTPRTQPNLEQWNGLYEMARYSERWQKDRLNAWKEEYEAGRWRPDIRLLEEEEQSFVKELVRCLAGEGRITLEAVDGQRKQWKVEMEGGKIVNRQIKR
ncbi:ankyrin repeat, PH and SEC7 domain containing protein secG [Aspergillus udagawae]|uniref:Ankyrin repeat, PH and SEC7 domain containing protein secG n=1 Tax=Aspergillus udagawae TaxID=91492 RepID=A0ABQ1BD89_9EURO|nr:ankyrin repeat, PH and SEC7 domain containing protein secG [Aspergillus udagawae]